MLCFFNKKIKAYKIKTNKTEKQSNTLKWNLKIYDY